MVISGLKQAKVLTKRLICFLALTLAATWVQAETYRYVDENGVVHYTDRPVEGAEVVELRSVQSYSNRRTQRTRPTPTPRNTDAESEQQAFSYERFEVSRPINDGTIWNTAGRITVSFSVEPSLRQGHRVRMFLDGEPVPNTGGGLSATLEGVDRGTHELRAVVENQAGQVIVSSDTSVFHYRQTIIPANRP